MKKLSAVSLLIASTLFGCASPNKSPSATTTGVGKGTYYTQDKTQSLAANLVAFSGYNHLISDHSMPSDLKASLDFTSGAYMGFNSFNNLWGAGGIGLLSVVSDNTLPYQSGVMLVMVKLELGEKYNDLTVAERAITTSLQKIDFAGLDPYYQQKPEVKKFLSNKSMSGVKCKKPSAFSLTDTNALCDFGDSDFGVSVIFSRPATGQEFPELALLPKGEYSVMLMDQTKYPMYELRNDAWGSVYHARKGYMSFNDLKLPFVAPDNSGKRIAFQGEGDNARVIYK